MSFVVICSAPSLGFSPGKLAPYLSGILKWYNFNTVMEFVFDPRKSATNRAKHGIDFTVAQRLWDDPELLEIPARTDDEPRWLLIGRIAGRHWSAIVTSRGDAIRLISVRRSRAEEVQWYEGQDV